LEHRSLLPLDVPNLLLVAARPATHGEGVILNLREVDGKPAQLSTTEWRIGGRPVRVREVSAIEEDRGGELDAVSFEPRGVKFLRCEPR
ncbi:MAG: hypothetical protein HZB38_15405, partial [Planctomycetes bacterium]|nr:hypothetical protein [Planctomycetota bacterium]